MNFPQPILHLLFAVALVLLTGGCGDDPEPEKKKPDNTAQAPPDSLRRIGDEVTQTIDIWVDVLESVQNEASAAAAKQQLAIIAGQFDALAERAGLLPKVTQAEYQRIDKRMDDQVRWASNGLEHQRTRIFAMPASIRDQVLPASDVALERFRAMGRTISAVSVLPEADPESSGGDGDDNKDDDKKSAS